MRLGMFMHPIQDYKRGYHTLLKEDLDVIRTADREGFDEVWLGEHYFLPSEPFASPLMIFARLAAECPRITFGAGVVCLPQKHPAIVAGEIAQIDHMLEGRFMFGVGPGGSPPDFEAFDVVDKNRAEMVEESVDIILKLWSEDPPYDIQGKYWSFKVKDNVLPDLGVGKMTVPFQKPYPQIMLPSMSRGSASAKLTARRGWHMISANFVPEDIAIGHYKDWAAERQRLSLPVEPHKYRAGRTLLVCDTDEEARAYLKHPDCAMRWYFHYIIGLTGHGGFVGMLKNDPNMKDSDVTVDYCLENIVIAGSPETVAKKLAAFRDKVGPFETLIVSHHDWVHRDIWQRHMHLVSHKMMPILRDLTGTQHLVERARAAE